jgi:hypothetical protein
VTIAMMSIRKLRRRQTSQRVVNKFEQIGLPRRFAANVTEKLTASPGLRPEDIFINLVEVLPANWSFGHGEAQYVK